MLFAMQLKKNAAKIFGKYKPQVEEAILREVAVMGEKNALRDAVEYALMSGGKRFRPIIVILLGEALNKGFNVTHAALSVEFFHTASLIADDLPCMDNEEQRRDKATLHKVFDESTALLASFTLISGGYEMIYKCAKEIERQGSVNANEICVIALQHLSRCAGIKGATNGQFLDLSITKPTIENIRKVIYQKTITLFEIAFILGWIFGGGELEKLEEVIKCANYFGMAFQIADDIKDLKQDIENENKINMAKFLGKEESYKLFNKEIYNFEEQLESLNLLSEPFKQLISLLKKAAQKAL